MKNEFKDQIVKVSGDCGVGVYEVKLIEQYFGDDVTDDEVVYKAEIVDEGIFKGNICYVVKGFYKNKGYWGGVDPFINKDV